MDKFLIFDADNSLASLGTVTEATEMAGGIPPLRITKGIAEVYTYLQALFTPAVTTHQHILFGKSFEVPIAQPTPIVQQHGLTGIVIDTLSHTFNQDKRILEDKNPNKALEKRDWGTLDRMYNKTVEFLKTLPVWVVVTVHSKYDKDDASGALMYMPQLQGGIKENLSQFFDVVVFTKVSRDGKKTFTFTTAPDASKFAKDRRNLLASPMPQDIGMILTQYRANGWPNPKILIIGESGTGKTRSLSTINQPTTKAA